MPFPSLSPIAVFTYKKLTPLKETITALQKNTLAKGSELIVYSDGPKGESDRGQIEEVRSFLKRIDGFKTITIKEAGQNKGLATSIIDGVSEILKSYNSVIVLEDDLVTSVNFLDFMNQALKTYETDRCVHSIAGYTVPIEAPKDYPFDNYFTRRASSWGWATWKDRWDKVDWAVSDYPVFSRDKVAQRKFNAMGSDMSGMLAKQMTGQISSWAIRWCYHQFKHSLFSAYPTVSKVANIGFGEAATHTKGNQNRFATPLDVTSRKNFNLKPAPELDRRFVKQFVAKYSLRTRAFYKIKDFLGI
jgi:hypothetical protein